MTGRQTSRKSSRARWRSKEDCGCAAATLLLTIQAHGSISARWRYDKLLANFMGFVKLAAIVKSSRRHRGPVFLGGIASGGAPILGAAI
jgi:hypothetical protein